MIKSKPKLAIGDTPYFDGCFTEEYFIRGLNFQQIGAELGLPKRRMVNGAFIAYAVQFPTMTGFHLGGWTAYETALFMEYRRNKIPFWNEEKFEEVYSGKRFPMSIEEAKKAWLRNMRHEKLIKVILNVDHRDDDDYPQGGRASQIIVTRPIECHVVQFLNGDDVFRGVWR